jgi:hypothetical protein
MSMENLMSKLTRAEFIKTKFDWPDYPRGGCAIEWLDATGLIRLARGRVAKIELAWTGSSDHLDKLRVTLISVDSGVIDAKDFPFADYLEPVDKEEAKKNHNSCYGGIYVWRDSTVGLWDWYIDKPRITSPVVNAIYKYIDIFG